MLDLVVKPICLYETLRKLHNCTTVVDISNKIYLNLNYTFWLRKQRVINPLCARNKNCVYANLMDPSQLPSTLVACLRSNLFATQSIISDKKKQILEVLNSRQSISIFRNYPAFNELINLWHTIQWVPGQCCARRPRIWLSSWGSGSAGGTPSGPGDPQNCCWGWTWWRSYAGLCRDTRMVNSFHAG